MTEIHQELLSSAIVEGVAAPDVLRTGVQIAAAAEVCTILELVEVATAVLQKPCPAPRAAFGALALAAPLATPDTRRGPAFRPPAPREATGPMALLLLLASRSLLSFLC